MTKTKHSLIMGMVLKIQIRKLRKKINYQNKMLVYFKNIK
uniref:Uncharacterized protein n=1 Tax=Polysiphonia sp. TaxID=1967842 RepID=A0A1Z1MU58_9FLOR|nr:hypothetical protein [Polysiphonia sp.]